MFRLRWTRRRGHRVGAVITAFGLSGDRLWVALVCLAVAGSADVVSAVFRSTLQQLVVADALRGRLAAFNIVVVVVGGPRPVTPKGGLVASAFAPTVSLVSGVLRLVDVAAIAATVPRFAQ